TELGRADREVRFQVYLTRTHLDRALDRAENKGLLAEIHQRRSELAIPGKQPRQGIVHDISWQRHGPGGQTSHQGGALYHAIHNAKKPLAIDGLAPARLAAKAA